MPEPERRGLHIKYDCERTKICNVQNLATSKMHLLTIQTTIYFGCLPEEATIRAVTC